MSATTPYSEDHAFDLSDEEVRRLQKILNSEGGYQYSEIEAKYRGLELLEVFRMLLDPKADEERRRRPSLGPKMVPPPPSPPPEPQPFPMRLDVDHRYEVESSLRMLEYELERVKTYPSSWRWVVVAAYNALGHTLMLKHPAEPKDPLHHLVELFDVVAEDVPEIKAQRAVVERLQLLRTTWLPRPVGEWPTNRADLGPLIRRASELITRVSTEHGRSLERTL